MEENAKLMIRAMIQAAKADGEIDLEEQQKILAKLGEIGPEERAFVEAEMRKPVDIMGLAQDTGDAMKAQVYAMSLMAVPRRQRVRGGLPRRPRAGAWARRPDAVGGAQGDGPRLTA